MAKKYHIGYVLESGRGVITDGPIRIDRPNRRSAIKWKVKCIDCSSESWKFSNTFNGLKYGCKKCYDESLKRFDNGPAKKKAWTSLKSNAKSRGIQVGISFDEFCNVASKDCVYCGAKPVSKSGFKDWQKQAFLNGIDRINNDDGYYIGNIVSCCYQCNWSKRDLSINEWSDWIMNLSSNFKTDVVKEQQK